MRWQARLTRYWAYSQYGIGDSHYFIFVWICVLPGSRYYQLGIFDTGSQWEQCWGKKAESGRRLWEAFVLPQQPLGLAVFRQLQPGLSADGVLL